LTLRTLMQAGPAKASELFARLAETSGGALKTRERLFEELKAELETHVGLEERHLFPVLRKHAETKGLVAAAIKDNKELRALLAELDALPKDDEAFPARLSELREAFRQHARDETKELLPAVRKALSEEQVQDVTERMEAGLAEAEQAKRDEEEERRAAARQERERAEAREQQEEEAERECQAAARRTREAALQTARAVTRTAEAATEVAAEGARQASRSVAEGAENLATAAPLSTGFLFWDMWLGMAGLQPSRPAPSRGRADASSAKDASGQQEQVIPLAEEVLTVGTKKVSAGTARIRRYVVETPVEKQVALVRERVVVERRRPVADRASGETLTEVTVEVTETDEVPVVGKAVRLREEVVIRTERAERVETVRDTVRRDEVEVERADRRAARLRAPAARA